MEIRYRLGFVNSLNHYEFLLWKVDAYDIFKISNQIS